MISLIIVPIFLLIAVVSALAPHSEQGNPMQAGIGIGLGIVMAIFAPILYGAMGFLVGALAGLVYNLVARWTGGIEYVAE